MPTEPRSAKAATDGFGALFRATAPTLTRYAQGALRSHADAEDVVQTAALNVFRNWATVRRLEPAQQRRYLRTAVRRQVIQEWRKRQSLREDLYADIRDITEVKDDWIVEWDGHQIDLVPLWRAISCLPAACQEVVSLYAAGFDYGEIAKMLGISNSAVSSHINNGRNKLRVALPQPWGELT